MKPCTHLKIEFLWRRDGVDYLRCLDCDQVFEAEDLEAVPSLDESEEEKETVPAAAPRKRH
jgi:hypothetical protein